MRLTTKELLEYVKPILIEKFGKNTALDKHDLSPWAKASAPKARGENPTWSIITLGDTALNYKIHGAGATPASALKAAGLKGLIDDAKSEIQELLTSNER